jgi:hypothetical protein
VTSTAEWRIAHFSDTHVLSLEGATAREFLDKRATGAVNLAFKRVVTTKCILQHGLE